MTLFCNLKNSKKKLSSRPFLFTFVLIIFFFVFF